MKAILLGAGKGTRISRMVKAVPKCTLPIDGKPLIKITVDMLQAHGIDTTVCVGYCQNYVKEALKDNPVTYYYNPFFDVTNSIASLWFAKDAIDDDMLIMNADVFFNEAILNSVINDERDVVMMVDKTRTKTGDYFFSTTDNGCIREYGKELPLLYRNCEYVGISKISKNFVPQFKQRLEELICQQNHNMWWEDVIYSFAKSKERDIYTKDVEGQFWSEIDYFDDYERILNYINRIRE